MSRNQNTQSHRTTDNNSSNKFNNKCCEMTFVALNKWYEMEFQKLGWMILAKDKGMNEKIDNYKMCLEHLHQSLKNKIKDVNDIDKKHDLKLMCHNIVLLIKHVNKDFN
jgi:hypothetical protein